MAWVAQKPGVTAPIIGATKEHHLDDAVAALSLTLTLDEVAALEEPYVPHAVVGLN
jgi:aryl-alcohol dehydrogenase-like predicted oxidoreductase